jgi:hypothetical protein
VYAFFASSRSRVGDFSLINFDYLFSSVVVAVGMWATLLRCPHVHSDVALCVAELRAGGALLTFAGETKGRFGMLSYL